jgi:hypothetical protein
MENFVLVMESMSVIIFMGGEDIMPFFKKFYNSVVNINMYPKMVKEGTGKAFLYLFLFTLIFGTISGLMTGYNVNQAVGHFSETVKNELPEFTLENGTLDVQGDMPMILDETEKSVFAIDTSGELDESFLESYETGVLVLKHRAINKQNPLQVQEYQFGNFNITLTKSDVVNWLPYLNWAGVIAGIFIFVFFFIGKMASALFVALIGLIASAVYKAKMSFGQLYSTSIYALTVPILLDLVFKGFHTSLPFYVYYIIAIVYVVVAVEKMKKPVGE